MLKNYLRSIIKYLLTFELRKLITYTIVPYKTYIWFPLKCFEKGMAGGISCTGFNGGFGGGGIAHKYGGGGGGYTGGHGGNSGSGFGGGGGSFNADGNGTWLVGNEGPGKCTITFII